MAHTTSTSRRADFERIMRENALETVFQPIVALDGSALIGYEALSRAPEWSSLSASELLDEAYETDRVVEFDWAARAAASRAALAVDLDPRALLFVNVEPLALASECPPKQWADIERAFSRFRIVLEITERSLDRDPSALLEGVGRQRQTAAGVALDDVGADIRTLSLLPVLSADVLKLDLSVTRAGANRETAKTLDIVYEEHERTGATLLAEGVEFEEHLATARSLGARLGQGHLLGRPAPNLAARPLSAYELGPDRNPVDPSSPFAVVDHPIGIVPPETLRPLANQIAFGVTDLADPSLVLIHVPRGSLLDPDDLLAMSRLASRGVVTAMIGPDMPVEPAPGIRGVAIDEPMLNKEWAVVVLGPGVSAALLARAEPDGFRYAFAITHDRARVISAARCLLRQLGPWPS